MNSPYFTFAPLAGTAKKISFEELADPINVVVYAGDAMAENSDTRAILQRAHKVELVPDAERTEQTLYVSTAAIMTGSIQELAREGVTRRVTLVTGGKLDHTPLMKYTARPPLLSSSRVRSVASQNCGTACNQSSSRTT